MSTGPGKKNNKKLVLGLFYTTGKQTKKRINKSDPWEKKAALKISFPGVWRSAGNDDEIAISYIHTFVRAHTDTAGRH